MMSDSLSPVLYLPHGGGPLPLLGDTDHAFLTEFLKNIPKQLGNPSAILMISAHWQQDQATISSGKYPDLIFDYSGFPAESYQFKYPAPGNPSLAEKVKNLIHTQGLPASLNDQRGFDHGMFVPLMLMYPESQIPCVQLSLLNDLDPQKHIKIGKSLRTLRQENILIIGSGSCLGINIPHAILPFFIQICTDMSISI
jgi:aromatic ring-opening dioxygenase catalytic subunit (LigB family)